MRRRRRLAALAVVLGCAAAAGGAELQQTVESAYRAFLEGRLADAQSAYRYLATIGAAVPDPDVNLAVLARDRGDNDLAVAQWMKASLGPGADGFVWDERGWAEFSADHLREAKEAFLKGIDRSTTTATQAEANLGLGLLALAAREPKSGLAPLRSALVQGPYALSAASYEMALIALAVRDGSAALAYLRQSVEVDPLNFEALVALARFEEKIGETRVAWTLYGRLQTLDPQDKEFAGRLRKLAQFIDGNPQDGLPVRRLARPMLDATIPQTPPPSPASASLRVALFCDRDGKPAAATHFYFMTNADFKLVAADGEVVNDNGKALDQWEATFRPESNLVEVRDPARNIEYTAKQPFKIVPQGRLGTVLIKSAQFTRTFGFDRGDRELRGSVEVIPTPFGFKLVNEVQLEDYLRGVVGAALPEGSPSQAYEAQAIVARSTALWQKAQSAPTWERADICDSEACQRYLGVNEEMQSASRAVAATDGTVLTLGGRIAHLSQTEDCGGTTESGRDSSDPSLEHLVSVHDGPMAAVPLRTPAELERWTHDFPPKDLYCEAGNVGQSHSRWIRVIPASELKERAARIEYIGDIKNLRVAGRTATGRVRALIAEGTRGTLRFEGAQQIGDFLSPGSLRSTLFTITPVMKGKVADRFILWGAGTGSGLGMCLAGAVGQASLGRNYRQILETYFPELRLENVRAPKRTARRAPRHHLNPRLRRVLARKAPKR